MSVDGRRATIRYLQVDEESTHGWLSHSLTNARCDRGRHHFVHVNSTGLDFGRAEKTSTATDLASVYKVHGSARLTNDLPLSGHKEAFTAGLMQRVPHALLFILHFEANTVTRIATLTSHLTAGLPKARPLVLLVYFDDWLNRAMLR